MNLVDDRDERREEQEIARSRETVADIVADIRERAENAMRNGERLVHNEAVANMLTFVADRIEAAWKRDEERAVEHATRHAEAVARDNCRDCVHNPSGKNFEGGNTAAMREALVAIRKALLVDSCMGPHTAFHNEVDMLTAEALSAPPRNCDVGTADEQDARFGEFCVMRRTGSCAGCPDPVGGFTVANGIRECALVWAQTPYEASEISRAHRAGENNNNNNNKGSRQ